MIDIALEVVQIALVAVVLWVAVVWVCGGVYVAVTFVHSLRHVPARPVGAVVRSVLRESWVVAWTQPLMLYYQLFRKRMGSGGGAVPVVLVHGYFQNRVDFLYLAHRLKRRGAGPLFAVNFLWPQSLDESSDDVLAFIERVIERTGASQVDLLTHSSGGLFALDIIAENPGLVRRAALIALPGRGVQWRGPVLGRSGSQLRATSGYQAERTCDAGATPVLSIFSAHDNLVNPVSTSLVDGARARNVEVEGLGHLAILFD
ncbi:MAG: hypothetical protein FDZ75_02300, partial [Actinobacteria bacterium]